MDDVEEPSGRPDSAYISIWTTRFPIKAGMQNLFEHEPQDSPRRWNRPASVSSDSMLGKSIAPKKV